MIAYDEANGSFAARAWWLLKWLGHSKAAVLDGGIKAWIAAGGALESGLPPRDPGGSAGARRFIAEVDPDAVVAHR